MCSTNAIDCSNVSRGNPESEGFANGDLLLFDLQKPWKRCGSCAGCVGKDPNANQDDDNGDQEDGEPSRPKSFDTTTCITPVYANVVLNKRKRDSKPLCNCYSEHGGPRPK